MRRANILIVLLMSILPLVACSPDKPSAGGTGSGRTAAPNITGTWEVYPDPFANGNIFDDPPPPNGGPDLKEPFASAWKKIRQDRERAKKAGHPLVDASTRCLPEGMPTIMGATYPIQILQTPGQITVLAEFLTQTRRVLLDQKMPGADDIPPSYNGTAVGHWEGETLVVETRGVREDVHFLDIPHSASMKITERIRLTAPDLIENKIEIDDPTTLKRPYKFSFGYKRNNKYKIQEYICDNNQNVVNTDGSVSLKLEKKKDFE